MNFAKGSGVNVFKSGKKVFGIFKNKYNSDQSVVTIRGVDELVHNDDISNMAMITEEEFRSKLNNSDKPKQSINSVQKDSMNNVAVTNLETDRSISSNDKSEKIVFSLSKKFETKAELFSIVNVMQYINKKVENEELKNIFSEHSKTFQDWIALNIIEKETESSLIIAYKHLGYAEIRDKSTNNISNVPLEFLNLDALK